MMVAVAWSQAERRRRRGTIQVLLVLLFVTFVLLLAWVVNNGRQLTTYAELQRLADAASISGTLELVDDAHLRGYLDPTATPTEMPGLLQQAHDTALAIAALNLVNGQPLTVNPNYPVNDPSGDIVLGFLDNPTAVFVPANNLADPNDTTLIDVNAVRVRALMLKSRNNALKYFLPEFTGTCEAELTVEVTAMMDRDVIGFRPFGSTTIPLAPVALRADFGGAPVAESWQKQIEGPAPSGTDDYEFDGSKLVAGGPDGLLEFRGKLALDCPPGGDANLRLLYIGTTTYAEINTQLATGVTATDLAGPPFGGAFVLDANNQLDVPGSETGPGGSDLTDLQLVLENLRDTGAVRIWPLYDNFATGTCPDGTASIRGFVAARVAEVIAPAMSGDPLEVILQPTMISTGTAVTDFAQRNAGGVSILNKYIAKIRIVQ